MPQLKQSAYVKLRIWVPVSHADALRRTLGERGAGRIGKYSYASASVRCIGRFLPDVDAHPAVGAPGNMEEVEEEMIETVCHIDLLPSVIAAVRAAHPYEEPAIDILPRLEIE